MIGQWQRPHWNSGVNDKIMQLPLEIVFKDLDHSDAVEARVRQEAQKLERFFSHITSCRVVIEAPHKPHSKGNLYRVGIHLTVPPSRTIDVTRTHADDPRHADINVAVKDAFKAAARQLEDYAQRLRGDVKTHG